MPSDLPVALVTGSSRGIGAETAFRLAARGVRVIITYREKARRAEQIVAEIEARGGSAFAVGADLTDEHAVATMITALRREVDRLDILVLNASGGMEADVEESYAMRLNRDAQVMLLDRCRPLLRPGARVVFVTSHQAHFVRDRPVTGAYEPVAWSKRAGEDAVRSWATTTVPPVELAVVSGDMIEGTITVRLIERAEPGTMAGRLEHTGAIPTIAEFATAITTAATGPAPPDTVYVGGDDYPIGRSTR